MTVFRWVRISAGWFPAELDDSSTIIYLAAHPKFYTRSDILEYGPTLYRPIPYTPRATPAQPAIIEVEVAKDDQQPEEIEFPHYHITSFVPVASERKNDCCVVALANVASLSYKVAKLKCFHHGWSSTRGMDHGFLELVLDTLEFTAAFRSEFTGLPLQDFHADGVYLVYIKDHVMPSINGNLLNHGGLDNPIEEVYEVTV